jgi:hypothetical protein
LHQVPVALVRHIKSRRLNCDLLTLPAIRFTPKDATLILPSDGVLLKPSGASGIKLLSYNIMMPNSADGWW